MGLDLVIHYKLIVTVYNPPASQPCQLKIIAVDGSFVKPLKHRVLHIDIDI